VKLLRLRLRSLPCASRSCKLLFFCWHEMRSRADMEKCFFCILILRQASGGP